MRTKEQLIEWAVEQTELDDSMEALAESLAECIDALKPLASFHYEECFYPMDECDCGSAHALETLTTIKKRHSL